MRDRMERFVVLPFSVGCISDSSVAVAALTHNHKRSKSDSNTSREIREEDEESMRNMFKFLALSKPEVSTGFHRLFKSFKMFSQLFAYKEDMDEFETEMEIGCPTNVKHVSHIGLGDPVTTDPGNGWEGLVPPELLPLGDQTRLSVSIAPTTDKHQLLNAST